MMISLKDIGRWTDVSAVRTDVTMAEVEEMIKVVRECRCICASPMPWITKYVVDALADRPETVVTGVVGFPSGAVTTAIKTAEAKEHIRSGCRELDMVLNVSALRSGKWQYVFEDIRAVAEAAEGFPLKVILEVCYLTDDEICRAAETAVRAGAAFVKTGTGWGTAPTTAKHIRLIRRIVGASAKIKAAGGVRDLDTLLAMQEAGCDRFGIGVRSAKAIFSEAYRRAGVSLPACLTRT